MRESSREYECTRCGYKFPLRAPIDQLSLLIKLFNKRRWVDLASELGAPPAEASPAARLILIIATGCTLCHVSACATGAHSLGEAARSVARGDADVMVAGGTEHGIIEIGVAGFCAARALSTRYNDDPTAASRPWDKGRDGFVMGSGAGVVILEELEHARARGANILAEVRGYGMSGDAHHITAPPEDGNGGRRAMEAALRSGSMNPEDIDYVNAHGTSTPLGDLAEFGAVRQLFGEHRKTMSMSSTKSAVGHALGAAGALEAIFCLLAIRDQVAPPTLNLNDPEDTVDMDLVPNHPRERQIRATVSNSFGFGGTNGSVIFSAFSG